MDARKVISASSIAYSRPEPKHRAPPGGRRIPPPPGSFEQHWWGRETQQCGPPGPWGEATYVAGQSFYPNPTGHLSQAREGKLCVLAVIRPVPAVFSRSTQICLVILLACTTMLSISVASAPTANAAATSTQRLGAL